MQLDTFFALVGIDRCGKGTQFAKIQLWLNDVLPMQTLPYFFAEPNDDNPTGRYIRQILTGKIPKPKPHDLQRLFVLDRGIDAVTICARLAAQSSASIFDYRIVGTDRFWMCTCAYGMADGIPFETIMKLHEDVIGPFMVGPINIVIDIPAEEAMRRRGKDKSPAELFEKQSFLERVRENYLVLAETPPFRGRTFTVDGTRSTDEVFEDIKKIIAPRLLATSS